MKTCVVYVPITWPTISRRFFESWVNMTGIKAQMQLVDTKLVPMIETRFPLDVNRNQAVERALNDHKADYLMFLDADMVCPEDTLPRLLERVCDETPVVSGVYWMKKPPYACVAGNYVPLTGDRLLSKGSLEKNGFMAPDGQQTLFYERLKSPKDVQPVDVTGMGCLMVRSDVFKRLKQPYFVYVNEFSTAGDYTFRGGVSEDMWFASELRKAGIKTLLDPSIKCGHLAETVHYEPN